jgi:hypothetical protein
MMSLLFIVITILVLIINSNAFHTSITSNRLVNNKKLIDKKFIIDNSIVSTSSTSTSLSYRSNTKLNAVLKSQITKLIDRKDLTPEEIGDSITFFRHIIAIVNNSIKYNSTEENFDVVFFILLLIFFF